MTISVIMAAYNSGLTIERSLKSIICQTKVPCEIIVIDDGSTDNTAEIVREFKEIRFFHQNNSGPAAARNNGVRLATGDFVAFLDSDDYWEPDHLEKITGVLKMNPDLKWAASGYRKLPVRGKESLIQLKKRFYLPGFRADYFDVTPKVHFLSVISTVVKRDFFLSANGFAEKYSRGEDLSLWLRLALSDCCLGYSPDPTAVYISTPESLTSREGALGSLLQRIIDDYAVICTQPESLQARAWPVVRPWLAGIVKKSILSKDTATLEKVTDVFRDRLGILQRTAIIIFRWLVKAQ